MDYHKRLQDIAAFLKPYQRIWQNEIMLMYPDPLKDYPASWIEELASFKQESDVIRLEKKDVKGLLHHPELLAFYQRIEELSAIPKMAELDPMPEDAWTFLHMIPKKQHEIRKLAPFTQTFYHQLGIKKIIDIGGGIGLLAQTLNNAYDLKLISVDMDPELQKTGIDRHQKNSKHSHNKVQYQNLKVNSAEPEFLKLLDETTMTLGLHTCGELANDQIKATAQRQASGLINFGCCYQRLDRSSAQNISGFSQTMPDKLEMNLFALTLAARAHKKMSSKDFQFKLKVKFYRYAIHLLLTDVFHMKNVLNLGNSSRKLYDQPFSVYAQEQLKRIGVTPPAADVLDDFYQNPDRLGLIWKMITAGLIRNALGRLLEIYLLLDRVIYLQENGFQADLYEFFDEETSPRNLGIVARRK